MNGCPAHKSLQRWPFFDYGRSWNSKLPTGSDIYGIYSVGIGLRWAFSLKWPIPMQSQFELYWGHKLKDVETAGGNLQDKGLHFQFVIGAF